MGQLAGKVAVNDAGVFPPVRRAVSIDKRNARQVMSSGAQ